MWVSFRRLAVLGVLVGVGAVFASTAYAGKYVVLYKQESLASNAAATIQKAGGSVVATYPQIGVVIASSDSASFQEKILADSKVESAASTAGLGVTAGEAQKTVVQSFLMDDSGQSRRASRRATRRR